MFLHIKINIESEKHIIQHKFYITLFFKAINIKQIRIHFITKIKLHLIYKSAPIFRFLIKKNKKRNISQIKDLILYIT